MLSLAIGSSAAKADRHNELVVFHPPTNAPTYLDLGEPGASVGDIRIWHFDGTTGDGAPVVMEWIMTTTGLETAGPGSESRVTLGVFSFRGVVQDQILIQGVGLYDGGASTFKPDSTLTRAIIGGTGKYLGAAGEVLSIHFEDGSWEHVFKLEKKAKRNTRED